VKHVPLIQSFDPWQSSLCTCPAKLTFNPYTGCDHGCLYCYATGYAQNFGECHPKKEQLPSIEREAMKLKGETISISSSSDPYPTIEASLMWTRKILQILSERNCKIAITTKSNIVIRDIDLLIKVPSTVALTITTDDDQLAKTLEPHAPTPTQRIDATQELIKAGIPVIVRIDPIIPLVNDQPQELIEKLASIGVKHIISSTYKPKADNWMRMKTAMPKNMAKIEHFYFKQGEKVGGNILLPKELRLKIMGNVRELVLASGMTFAVCREGISELNTAACDGSHLMPKPREGYKW
jgi:DNA repair photolyase